MLSDLIYRSFDPNLQEPIAFSGWKHHLGYIARGVKTLNGIIDENQISTICNGIGGSVLDLYIGSVTPSEISLEIIRCINELSVNDTKLFSDWLASKRFRVIELSDSSMWVLRMGRFSNRFIHIHPARYSPLCLRIKPTALRSAIAYCLTHSAQDHPFDLSLVNRTRQSILNLPPLAEGVVNHQIFNLVRYIIS